MGSKGAIFLGLWAAGLLAVTGCSGDAASTESLSQSQSVEDISTTTISLDSGYEKQGAVADVDAVDQNFQPAVAMAETTTAVAETRAAETIDTFNPAELPLRQIIYSAEVSLEVADVQKAGERISALVQKEGGYIAGENIGGGQEVESQLTLKVPPSSFQKTVAGFSDIGTVRSQRTRTDDVTERVVDLESQLTTAEASVVRLRRLLDSAQGLDEIAKIEQQLLVRETSLEQLRGQLKTLEGQIAFSTVEVSLSESFGRPAVEVNQSAYLGHDEGSSCGGGQRLTVERGDKVTVCFEVVNAGETALSVVDLKDTVLEIGREDTISVYGDLKEPLQAGQSHIVAYETEADRTLRTLTRVEVRAFGEEGEELAVQPVANTSSVRIEAVKPDGPPTFTEGLSGSWDFVKNIGKVLVLAVGVMIPLLILLPVGWLFRRTVWRRFRTRREEKKTSARSKGAVSSETPLEHPSGV